jgi:leucyl-tRNA synthetase
MDTFVDSSWYQYRYLSPASHTQPFDPERVSWLPVDIYTGGIEHAVMHLMYTRFWTKAMRDLGLARLDEPMKVLFNQGIILGPNSKRMSKTRGNVVNPDELVTQHGSDAVRCFLMFLGPWDQGGPWKSEGMDGIFRWFRRIRELATQDGATGQGAPDSSTPRDVVRKLNQTIRDVTEQLDGFRFNTAIARLMELTTLLGRSRDEIGGSAAWREALERLVLLLAPFAPHLAEECWEALGRPFSVHQQPWPGFSAELAAEDTIEIAVQVNGKLRCSIHVPAGSSEERLERDALAAERVVRELAGRTPRRVIVVPGRLVNVVV